MKFISIKPTLISFTVFLTILFLGSCGVAEETAPPNNPPPPDYMSFALTNLGGGPPVDPTTQLSRGDTYRLTITPASGTTIPTADYTVNLVPADAITINVTRTNSVDFTINNTATTSITVTVTHKTDNSVRESVTLTLAPQADYMSFVLTNSSGTTVTTTTELSRGSTYGLVITPASGTTIPTADYTITYTPATAITTNVVRTNSVDFTVNNITDRTVTISVAHRTNSTVSNTLTLNLPNQIATSFQEDIENATTMPYMATANALTREVLEPLGANAGATLVKRYVTESGGATTRDGTSWATAWTGANLRANITNITDATANRVYLVMIAGGTYKPDYSATVGTTERDISFSMTNHVAIMGGFDPAGGWGRTGTTIFSGDIGAVGNGDNSYHVFNNSGTLNNAHLYGVTIINGNANGSNPQNVGGGMYNSGSSPVLTEVVFRGNTANSRGGGMANDSSSPVLTRVVFSGNTAGGSGGGMYNVSSSPVLTEVVFSGNTGNGGGGMYNIRSSSPVLTGVVFSGNTAGDGGGMFNDSSSPVLTGVVFSGNTATRDGGGGMYNIRSSSPVLTRVVFSGNTATGTLGGGGMYNLLSSSPVMIGAVFTNNRAANGGGVYNDNGGSLGPLIVNTIFSGNTLSGGGSGPDIAVNLGSVSGTETIRIAGSVLGLGLAQPTNGVVGYGGTDPLNISYHSLTNGAVRFGADATLTINGMSFTYPTITTGSSAINLGLFVRKHVNAGATAYYFSETEATTSWHTSFTSTGAGGLAGTAVILPTTGTIEDLTTTDIAGNARNGRPDAGVYELP